MAMLSGRPVRRKRRQPRANQQDGFLVWAHAYRARPILSRGLAARGGLQTSISLFDAAILSRAVPVVNMAILVCPRGGAHSLGTGRRHGRS